jgi:hypothetical protein
MDDQPKYVEALRRTSIERILNFYKANYPHVPYKEQTYPLGKCPVLMVQGLEDMWLVPALVTVTKTGHWIHVGPVQAPFSNSFLAMPTSMRTLQFWLQRWLNCA